MTTFTNTHQYQQNNDAQYQAWVQAFIAGLDGVLLVQTADTGQIDPLTVARPAANNDGGYAIYRFDDAAHATNPIFLKFYFGADSAQTRTRIRVGVGTGSDGAGVLTNERIFAQSNSTNPNADSASSYFCYVPGFLGISFFNTEFGNNSRRYGLFIQRSTDAAGAPTDAGITVVQLAGSAASGLYVYNARTGSVWDSVTDITDAKWSSIACCPGNLTNFSVGADTEIVASFVKGAGLPMRVSPFLCFAFGSDIGAGATFTTTLVGAAATYIGTQGCPAIQVPWGSINNIRYCMRWE